MTRPARTAIRDPGEDFDAFCTYALPRLVGALTHHCGDRDLAEELAQEALARAFHGWDEVRTMGSPMGWCYRVGVNLSASWFRRRQAERRARARSHPADGGVHRDPDSADAVAVREALSSLTDTQRQAVICRWFLDLSVAETAAVMDSTSPAIRTLTHRAVARLRETLDLAVSQGANDVA